LLRIEHSRILRLPISPWCVVRRLWRRIALVILSSLAACAWEEGHSALLKEIMRFVRERRFEEGNGLNERGPGGAAAS
jgi:hypothetical protein